MASTREIRQGLADALSAIPGMQASPYWLSNPTPPAAHVFPARTEYDQAGSGGLDGRFWTVQVFVSANSDIGSQQRLDEMIDAAGPTSVKEVLEADTSLGGTVDDLRVEEMTDYREYVSQRGTYLGAAWRVYVMAARD